MLKHFTAEHFTAEDLIQVDGKTARATTFVEFVAALHSWPEPPEAKNFRAVVAEDGTAAARTEGAQGGGKTPASHDDSAPGDGTEIFKEGLFRR